MSALPGYFRHQLVTLLPRRHDLDAKIADHAFDLGVTEQELNSSEVARPSIDQGRFGAAQGMRPKQPRVETDAADPLGHQPGILAGGYVGPCMKSTWKEKSGASGPEHW